MRSHFVHQQMGTRFEAKLIVLLIPVRAKYNKSYSRLMSPEDDNKWKTSTTSFSK